MPPGDDAGTVGNDAVGVAFDGPPTWQGEGVAEPSAARRSGPGSDHLGSAVGKVPMMDRKTTGRRGSTDPSREKGDAHRDAYCPVLSFVDRSEFHLANGAVIASSIVELVGETDYPTWWGWSLFGNAFLLIFTSELALRVCYRGTVLFESKKDQWWAILDAAVVGAGVLDECILGLLLGRSRQNSLRRQVRLTRLLRVLRLFQMFPKLQSFLGALISMLKTFAVVFLVLFMFLLVSAIFLTKLVGHGTLWDIKDDSLLSPTELAQTQEQFRDVSTSLFTLFQVITQDNWHDIAGPLVTEYPWMRLYFVFFIAFASWTLISVLTGVASDEMILATTNRKEEERLEQEKRQKAFVLFLRNCFREADADGNGVLDKGEFDNLMGQAAVQEHMNRAGLEMNVDIMNKAWAMLNYDGGGEITIDDFVEGLSYLQETLSVKHVLNIDYSVKRTAVRFERCLAKLCDQLTVVMTQSEAILSFLGEEDDFVKRMHLELAAWRTWAATHAPSAVSSKRIQEGLATVRPATSPQFDDHPWDRTASSRGAPLEIRERACPGSGEIGLS